ncbi:MAG TPA: NTP transferase domain-containing protein [Steroidobacteraceae bacterium]|jgi:molybdopterin-guanine dinucleotide biosynthesis protein A|nr:NTP transferase domain-containing protein [Steroidobacteraceae bacterium]
MDALTATSPSRQTGTAAAPLYGLVLAGGRSSRMQRDKAALEYAGRTQLERTIELITPFVERAFVSVRRDQTGDPLRARFAQIVDSGEVHGPIAGLIAAQSAHPHAAWLVLACDLPLLDQQTLEHLLHSRQPERQSTAYRSSRDGLPEPLCAIYEPASGEAIRAYVASGRDCPRKFLLNADTALVDQPDPGALDNVNTPNEYGSALDRVRRSAGAGEADSAVAPSAASRRIDVQYYALLREQAARSSESLLTAAGTPRELYQELQRRYPFSLAPEMLRVAVNSEFGDWDQPLRAGDSVVFIPPVAGG